MPEPPAIEIAADDLLAAGVNRTIALRVREERRRQALTLQDVADRSGLSLGMVSKIENAQTSPSLRTVAKLAQAFELSLGSLLSEQHQESPASLVKAGQGIEMVRLGTRHGHRHELLTDPAAPRRAFEPYLVTLSDASQPYAAFQHEGTEFIYLLSGSVRYRYGSDVYDLDPGDSLFLSGAIPHGPEAFTDPPVKFLSLTVPRDSAGENRG